MLRLLFALTLFLSAALLFWVQPIFSRLMLPVLGGVPAVWNTCLVFYQITLLLGYAYAHVTSKWLRIRHQMMVHLLLLWGAAFIFSFQINQQRFAQHAPVLWLALHFITTIGLPFFLLSATTPMLQWWFAHTRHPQARHPYVLYAVSNVGSLLALLSYPFVVEPFFSLSAQTASWKLGYTILLVLLPACAVLWFQYQDIPTLQSPQARTDITKISNRQRLHWIILAFIPSSLLLSVTQHITTDIAAIPLFWVIPLCLFLLTFVLVFARHPIISHHWMLHAQSYLVLPLLVLYLGKIRTTLWFDFPLHLFAFFVLTMVCHGELAHSKPEAGHLTEFYTWMSLGGCLGGIFTALLAPILFHGIVEYPLMIALSCFIRPILPRRPLRHARWFAFVLIAGLLLFPLALATHNRELVLRLGMASLLFVTAIGGGLAFRVLHTPTRIGLGLGSFLLAGFLLIATQRDVLVQRRNFFGTLYVTQSNDGQFRLFYHGTTLHGAQHVSPEKRREPLTYFYRQGPVGQIFAALSDQSSRSVAVFGLGVGTIASYIRPKDRVTFYEIDPDVEQIARNKQWFTYLADCPGEVHVIHGDARISLQNAPDHSYDLIIQDAFSSDTIPVHLLTREAFQLYMQKLSENGVLIFNITNRHLNLEPVLAGLFQEIGLEGIIDKETDMNEARLKARKYPSTWMIATRQVRVLHTLQAGSHWQALHVESGMRLWTDDYSNIVSVLKFPRL